MKFYEKFSHKMIFRHNKHYKEYALLFNRFIIYLQFSVLKIHESLKMYIETGNQFK